MKSQKVLRKVLQAGNAKQLAADLGISLSTLYKWSEEGESGRRNPLELVAALQRCTGDRRLVRWLCAEAAGFYVENPVAAGKPEEAFVPAVFRLERELAGWQGLLAPAGERFSPKETKRLRKRWERLKSATEGFLVRCERGTFRGGAMLCGFVLWWFWRALPELAEAL